MCIGRPEEVKDARFLCGAPVIARVILVDNASEKSERIYRHTTIQTTDHFVYSQ